MNRLWGVGRLAVAVIAAAGVTTASMPRAYGGTVVPTVRSAAEVVSPQAVAVDARTGHVFVTDDSGGVGRVRMVDGATGAVLRTIAGGPSPRGVAVDARTGRVFVANWGPTYRDTGSVSVLDAATGMALRTVTVGVNPHVVAVDTTAGRVFVTNLYSVSVLDARTGRILRHAVLASTPSAVTVDEGRQRVFALADRTVTTFDARTGRPLCSAPVGGGAAAIAVDARTGRVFVARAPFGSGGLGAIMTLDASSGRPLRTLTLTGNPTTLAVDARHGHVFATDAGRLDGRGVLAGGGLDVLDARSGALVRRIPLGGIPGEVAIDEGTGRIVGASGSSSGAALPSPWDWIPGRLRRALRLPVPSSRTVGGSVTLLDLSR